jgi:hypothetical protein
MLSIFIMLFIAIAVTFGLGFSILTLINTAQNSLAIQANQVRLQNIANSIRASLTVDAGRVLLPINADYKARLPAASPFSTTTTGGEIVFCPAFLDDDGADTPLVNSVHGGGDETIMVRKVNLGDRLYASSGHAAIPHDTLARLDEMGVIAYLLSPQPNTVDPLRCGDVELAPDNYTLLVDGGNVVPVYTVTTDARGSVFVLSADGSKPSGYNGTDRIVRTLADVTDFIDKYKLADVTVKLPAHMTVGLADFSAFAAKGFSRSLRMEPQTGSSADLDIDAAGQSIDFGNAFVDVQGGLYLSGLHLAGKNSSSGAFDIGLDALPSANVVLSDATVQGLRTSGGRISAFGTTLVAPEKGEETTINPVVADGGEITVRSTAAPAVNAPSAYTVFLANGGTINLSGGLKVATGELSVLNKSRNSGRVVSASEDVNAQPALQVSRGAGYAEETLLGRSTVSAGNCYSDTGGTTCTASCKAGTGMVVISGGCESDNGSPLVQFGVTGEAGDAYTCRFSAAIPALSPKATAICDFR